jgi:PAS domain S-box-containing protein
MQLSEAEFRQVLDFAPQFVTVLGPRRERLYINRIGLDHLGTTLDRWRDTRPGAELHPDDLEPVQSHWNNAFSNGLPFECEFRSLRKDGIYRWLLGRCNPVPGEGEKILRWYVAFTDIEDRKRAESTESSAHSLDHIRLRRVLDYIHTNFKNDITLENLAGIAGYSAFHFARKFTLSMGIPPQRYIGRIRLEKAMAELAAGKLPLVEIALNAQFSSQASFTRAFHRATGMTPKEYQRRRR